MKVAQLTCVWPPYGGGIGKVAFEYSKILSSNYQVTVFTPHYQKNQQVETIANVEIELLPSIIKIGNAVFLPQLISKLKEFDVIHLHYPFFGAQELLAMGRYPKMIVSYHMVPKATGLKSWLFNIDCRWTEKKLANKIITWIVSSADYANNIVCPRLPSEAKIEILPFGAGAEFTPGNKSTALFHKLNISSDTPILLFVGGLDKAHAFKGVDVLIKAVARLSNSDFKMVIVGEGNRKNYYIQQARKLGVGSKMLFVGQVAVNELPEFYRLANALVLPSVNEAEAFGLVVLEAMACAKPVIASDLPGVRSLVKKDETGWLARPGDDLSLAQAIESILANLNQAKQMGELASKIIEQNYRWPIIGKKLLEIYKNI
ncbi:MAG: glycosyltransferase family 4 protein [Patescibacteria group bacterium]